MRRSLRPRLWSIVRPIVDVDAGDGGVDVGVRGSGEAQLRAVSVGTRLCRGLALARVLATVSGTMLGEGVGDSVGDGVGNGVGE